MIEEKTFHGVTWKTGLREQQNAIRQVVAKATEDLIVKGKNPTTYISKLTKDMKIKRYEAKRLLVTEGARLQTEVQKATYIENDFEEYEFIAESTACKICSVLDGKIFKVKDMQAGVNACPMHPHCHCSSGPHVDRKKALEKAKRIMNGGKDDENILTISDDDGIIRGINTKVEYMRNNLDSMAKHQRFSTKNALNEDISFKAKKDETTKYDVWLQKDGKKDRDTLELLKKELGNFDNVPRIVIVDNKKLQGIAGYDHLQDVLYVSNILNSKESIDEVLGDGYFASSNLNDILKHELTHKKHWDSARKLYNRKKKQYNDVKDAKATLDSQLISYVKSQKSNDFRYVYNISKNADSAFNTGNINELVAEVMVLGNRTPDKNLLKKVKEVLGYGSNGKTK